MDDFHKIEAEKSNLVSKSKRETEGILDVSSEQVKHWVNIIDLTEFDLKLIHAFSEQPNRRKSC
ncbi:hypothetical protein ACQKKK_12995 [Peribacillus sp. NPDC006672]|uniref:hypothetical protein n=1 Tax=Peribacillus sp. NPDC006672 TaxID=3390606 RepID=UPI003D02DE09